ncbi:MOSC domain-containing protein [Oceaniglobus ichthyenteri]|uniref:MOSC domain-containing protein n=1 Tax=Oceaniglobus ichthyenteri TaxID=2136177 RepID=UPI000D36580C|nr:MOSC domain-containing protein [Oceaniglobus ichthyenteri]
MPALIATRYIGTIKWLGFVPHRDGAEIVTRKLEQMPLTWGGYAPDCHSGENRPSCSRVLAQYKRNTEIRNTRQISIVSDEELAQIAAKLSLDRIDPAWVGASVVVKGIPDFTHIPPSARLQAENGTTLTVDMLNQPCLFPAKTIDMAHPGQGKGFKTAAKGKRGVTAWVERPGTLRVGDRLALHIPGQRGWTP